MMAPPRRRKGSRWLRPSGSRCASRRSGDQAEAARRAGAFGDALAQYEEALALDGTLAFAQAGRQAMTDRLALAGALEEAERTLGKDHERCRPSPRPRNPCPRGSLPYRRAASRAASGGPKDPLRLCGKAPNRAPRIRWKNYCADLKGASPWRPHAAGAGTAPRGTTWRWAPGTGTATFASPSRCPLEATPPAIAVVCRDRI
jgi:hypothetical protein